MKKIVLALLLLASPAFAVKVADCPSRIRVKVTGVEVLPFKEVRLARVSLDTELLEKSLDRLKEGLDEINVELGLAKKVGSVCYYGGYELTSDTPKPRLKFYTEAGVDKMRFAFESFDFTFGIYFDVASYSKTEVVLEESNLRLLVSDGSHGEFSATAMVGSAKAAGVKVLDVE